jgi:hypothetical protein
VYIGTLHSLSQQHAYLHPHNRMSCTIRSQVLGLWRCVTGSLITDVSDSAVTESLITDVSKGAVTGSLITDVSKSAVSRGR